MFVDHFPNHIALVFFTFNFRLEMAPNLLTVLRACSSEATSAQNRLVSFANWLILTLFPGNSELIPLISTVWRSLSDNISAPSMKKYRISVQSCLALFVGLNQLVAKPLFITTLSLLAWKILTHLLTYPPKLKSSDFFSMNCHYYDYYFREAETIFKSLQFSNSHHQSYCWVTSAVVLEVKNLNYTIIWPPNLLNQSSFHSIWVLTKAMGTKSSVNSLSGGFSVLQAHVLQRQRVCIVEQLQEDVPWLYECIPPRGRSFSVYKERFITI